MRNVRDYAIGIIAAVGFVSAIVSLLATRWKDVSSAVRIRRSFLITTLLIGAVIAAIVSVPPDDTVPLPITTSASSGNTISTTLTPLPVDTTHSIATPLETILTTETERVARPEPMMPVIRDSNGHLVPQLIAAANHAIDTAQHRVEGTLASSTTVEPDKRLKGMITARMSLQVKVTARGIVTAAFTIDSKGGGYTEAAALNQARDHLAIALGERLRQEISQ